MAKARPTPTPPATQPAEARLVRRQRAGEIRVGGAREPAGGRGGDRGGPRARPRAPGGGGRGGGGGPGRQNAPPPPRRPGGSPPPVTASPVSAPRRVPWR